MSCLLLINPSAWAEPDAAAAQDHLRAATEAYRDGDLDGFTASLEEAVALNPFSLPTQYNLACGYARTGRGDEALAVLRGLVAARVDFGMADDEDLATIRDQPAFRQLLATLRENTTPVHASVFHIGQTEPSP